MKNKIYSKIILFSIILMFASFISAQKIEQTVDENLNFRHFQSDIKPVTKKWFATQEAGGKWQVVGEAFFKNRGRHTQNIRKISVKYFTNRGVYKRVYKGNNFNEMLFVVNRGKNGEYFPRPNGTTKVVPNDEAIALLSNKDLMDEKPIFAWVQFQFENRRNANLFMKISEFIQSPKFEMPFDFDPDKYWYSGRTAGTYGHWSAIFPQPYTNFFLSQRYAIDFIQVNINGESSLPSESPNKEDYFAWNKDVKSAERGEVIAIVNDLPDVEIGQVDVENPAGNYVVIKHAPRIYTIYGHLKQASVIVQVGDKVKKGHVIGKVGNSGNSSEPHLHFHVMDNWDYLHPVISGLTSQGLPALFRNAKVFREGGIFPLNGNSISEGDVIIP